MMHDLVELELCEPAPFMFGDNGHLGVTDGEKVWIVVVTCEALRATAHPPEASVRRLRRYAALYRDMGEGVVAEHDDVDGKVWILERHILAGMGTRRDRRSVSGLQNHL